MNKRFSTLLAAALVAGGLSFNAAADSYLPSTVDGGTVKEGVNAYLKAGSDYLTVDKDGSLKVVSGALTGANLSSALWTIKAVPTTTVTGTTYAYQFTNKGTGQLLSIELKSNKAATGKDNLKIEAGNTTWGWDQTNGLYAVGTKDTTFWIDGVNMIAVEKGKSTVPSTKITYGEVAADAKIEMTADDFAALVKDGKLYFNGENVSTGQKNVLTANKWTAESYEIATEGFAGATSPADVLYLTNGEKVEGYDNALAATKDKKKYLVVDHSFYNAPANTLNALTVDTLSFDPTKIAADGTTAKINARTAHNGKHHPFAAAFKAEYYIANDSIVLTSLYQPASILVTTTLDKLATPTYATLTKVTSLVTAIKSFYEGAASGKPAADVTFAKATFSDAFAYDASKTTTGAELIEAAEKQIKEAKDASSASDADKKALATEKANANALIAAIKGLKVVTATTADGTPAVVTTDKYKDEANFEDGLTALNISAQTDKQIVVRKLSDTKVVTIATANDPSNLIALIQPYATKPGIGGDAEIAEGLYYVINAEKEKSAGVANEYYGKYFDLSPVNPAKYVGKAQAFNPYAQFVVEKAAGVAKGNYTILNRAGATDAKTVDKWFGVTNVVDKDKNIFAIGSDTIQLVAAEDVDADNAYIGFKYITANDAKNNKFTITSAADVLEGQSIVMTKDSTLKVAAPEDEVLYTLVPSTESKYGVEDALKKVTYTIMDADSAFIIKDASDRYVFSNGKYATKNGTPVQFSMIAVDTDSTFVLFDDVNDKKLVVSTQYKTISGEGLDARNDMFIVKPQSAPGSYKSLPKHVRIQAINGDYAAVNAKNQGIAVREGDLKADAYSNLDFIFWLDTAHYDNAAPYTYYITKGVKATEETAASRLYMWNSVDSADAKDANKELPYIYGTGANRVMFRTASIMAQDTLLVPALDAAAKIDTVSIADGKSVDGLKNAVKAGVKNFQFSFEFASKDAEGEYNIVCQNNNGKNYVHNINGVLAMGPKEDAVVVNVLDVSAEDETATDNETIAAKGVKVIASEGQVEITGAAGKKVVISNILGQPVANTILTSDNAVIAAPQGVVVVAVEGEEAVKAIIK
ncbi:DUF6383 domain-containing protein [Parabacteroides sp. ASD2025]|uniref:DUF6383 domain-containing protein n=1 Tax=Parabacteroides sp. ASD2025 TaxID=3415987 RepID=UPI003CF7CAFF